MVPERMVEPKSKLNHAHRVFMTTLLAASTRHCLTEKKKTVKTQDTNHILALKPKTDRWAGRKVN